MLRKVFWNGGYFTIFCIYYCFAFASSNKLEHVKTPAGIAGEQENFVIAELGKPFKKWCFTSGDPTPDVFWYRTNSTGMELVSTWNLLSLDITNETVGDYLCQANNSAEYVAWSLLVIQAYQTDDTVTNNPHLLPRIKSKEWKTIDSTLQNSNEISGPIRTPAAIAGEQETYVIAKLGKLYHKWCFTSGEPAPDVFWYRTHSTGMELVSTWNLLSLNITHETVGDYVCQANNSAEHVAWSLLVIQAYLTDDTVTDNPHLLPRIRTKGFKALEETPRNRKKNSALLNLDECQDSKVFANCNLIVRAKYCQHKYYAKFCCKSCQMAGQLSIQQLEMQEN